MAKKNTGAQASRKPWEPRRHDHEEAPAPSPAATDPADPSSSAGASRPTIDATPITPAAKPSSPGAKRELAGQEEHPDRTEAGGEGSACASEHKEHRTGEYGA
jgi:hypothetical protein